MNQEPVNQEPEPAAAPSLASKLLGAVLIKTFLETVVICLIVTLAAFSHFSPLLRGAIDVADARQVAGWAYDPLSQREPIEVQLFIDGRFAASQRADQPRADLLQAHAADNAQHGFRFTLASFNLAAGTHTIQVYALRGTTGGNKTLRPLANAPRIFQVIR